MTARKTLTQRRTRKNPSTSTSQIKPDNVSRLNPQSRVAVTPAAGDGDDGSVVKIIVWAVIILVTGVGLAMLVRNLTAKQEPATTDTTKTQSNTILLNTDDNNDNGISLNTDTDEDTTADNTTQDEDTTTDETTTDETDTTTEDDTTAPTGENLTNEYSQNNQYINDSLTTNSVVITGYSYANYSSNFAYKIKLSQTDKFPTVSASLDKTEKTLTVVVENISRDQIVGNGGTGHTDFNGADNTTSVDISNSNNKTTFVFNLNEIKDYRIFAESGDPQAIVVEIKN